MFYFLSCLEQKVRLSTSCPAAPFPRIVIFRSHAAASQEIFLQVIVIERLEHWIPEGCCLSGSVPCLSCFHAPTSPAVLAFGGQSSTLIKPAHLFPNLSTGHSSAPVTVTPSEFMAGTPPQPCRPCTLLVQSIPNSLTEMALWIRQAIVNV